MSLNKININNSTVVNTGVVYDISKATSQKYVDLKAALGTNGNNVPLEVREGGMSVRYIQANDNKYVQYMLSNNIWSVDERKWKKVNEVEVYSTNELQQFHVTDGKGYSVLGVVDGYIKTKNFDSSISEVRVNALEQHAQNLQFDNIGLGDLSFKDTHDYYIASFVDGHIKTKNFDSRNLQVSNFNSGDLAFKDANDYCIAEFVDGHIKTKNFNSGSIEYSNLSKDLKNRIDKPSIEPGIYIPLRKSINVLFIGNSISQDHVTYLPWLLNNIYNGSKQDKIDFTVGIFYIGSHRIDLYAVENWDNLKASIWSIAQNTQVWTNTERETSLNSVLQLTNWDIISIQGYFNVGTTDDVTKAVQFVSRLRQQSLNPDFKLAYLIHQTYRGDAMFKTILLAAETVIKQNTVDILFAPGISNEFAKFKFTNSQLSPDNTHNNEGLPCMIGAMECLSAILQFIDSKNAILDDNNILTYSVYLTLNVPGPDGTFDDSLNTEENYEFIKLCAISANNIADHLCKNLLKSNIYNYVEEYNN